MNKHYLLLNVDYLGTCYGTCRGCLLTEEERTIQTPFLSKEIIEKAMIDLKAEKPELENPKFAALAFGRGNTLALDDKSWDDIKSLSQSFQKIFRPTTKAIECSTGLVGKVEFHIEQAKKRIENIGHELRFVVAANSDLFSKAYWNNVDLFFESLMAFRGGRETDESGDVLVLNLYADNLPPLEQLLSRLNHYPFPVNVAWLPSKTLTKEKAIVQYKWIQAFTDYARENRWDCNLLRFVDSLKNEPLSFLEAVEKLESNANHFWWIQKTGVLESGLFSPYGDVDYQRLSQKLEGGYIHYSSKQIVSKLQKKKSCSGCPNQMHCLSEGVGGLIAVTEGELCPLGLVECK